MCVALLGIGLLGACGDDTVPCPADDHKLRVMVDAICPAAFAGGKSDDTLFTGVATDEMVRLIVDLPVKMGADSATITRTGDLVLEAMSTFEVADVKRLGIVPQLALRTKKAGVDHMRTCKLVCAFHTDALLEQRLK
jgi:hypothetical protein